MRFSVVAFSRSHKELTPTRTATGGTAGSRQSALWPPIKNLLRKLAELSAAYYMFEPWEVDLMPELTFNVDVEQIKALAFQLPPSQLVALADAIQERADTLGMMQLAETAFEEWNEEGEDIYDRDTETR
jgi:hypothetical protein